ncbi:MAG: UDP-phosphate alpha N-acetylglucosaminyltransferase [Ancylobacter novellus]|uniref:UDP-phosphate alpha N-acetylglucosaminyltransferase n=1 Tax=Ancylobacter novellus TaxID=921 RepID=A0A2W5KT94_ANCNO|nr:MAG: UDP-phosphate alpha N-acetylglucosaminyltransferase [Ancylobacter novellus]
MIAAAARPGFRDRLHPAATLLVLLGALTFNAVLCFANTNLFAVNETLVMGAEGVILVAAFSFALGRTLGLYVLLAAFLSYAALLMALRPMIDPKAVRDVMIPIAFYALGRRMPDPRLADRAALWSGAIVVAMGLFEFMALDTYIQFFNVIRYYVARGTVAPSDVGQDAGALFQSGMRPDARALFPFLGPHRASSVFLEPVSTGNFGAILIIWALFRKDMRFRLVLAAMGAASIILADARFGATVSIAAALAFMVSGRLPKAAFAALPFLILAALAVYGLTTAEKTWSNDFGGRILWTSMLLSSLSPAAVFGLSPDKPFLSDSGYAYTLNQIGLIGFAGLWTLFILLPDGSRRAFRFKAAAATYICLLLLISDSVYTIKTAALLWFMLGVAGGMPETAAARARPSAAYRPAAATG